METPYVKSPGGIQRLWSRLKGEKSILPEVLPEPARPLSPDELIETVASLPGYTDLGVEIELRRQLWRSSNDPCRGYTLTPSNTATIPLPDTLLTANLERLLDLLRNTDPPLDIWWGI